jgi:hypothetical protein
MTSAVSPMNSLGTHYERGSSCETYPIAGSTTSPFFPPVCLKSHWDPTRIYTRSVPDTLVQLPVDFRPYTKVCLEYRTTAVEQPAPEIPDNVVFPGGGEVYPPNRYLNSIDKESLLRRLDRPLGTCDDNQYLPPKNGDMYVDRLLVPKSDRPPSQFVEEISMPKALLRTGTYHCRSEADQKNWDRSPRLFNNATKQDRYVGPTEPPRQNIWNDARRCDESPTGTKLDQAGCRAWGC